MAQRRNYQRSNLEIINRLSPSPAGISAQEALALKEQLYNKIGEILVRLVKSSMNTPRMRYSKRPRLAKSIQYNTRASGNLQRSVNYELRIEEDEIQIDLLMLDYGVDNVYGDGSFPGNGAYAKDDRPKEARAARSALIEELTRWASSKLGLGGAQAKSMAFAVRKNLFKYGYGGVELFTPYLQTELTRRSLELLNKAPFDALPVSEELRTLFDRINTFGNKTYTLII